MERMAEYRKAKAIQNSINIQLHSELYNTLHEGSNMILVTAIIRPLRSCFLSTSPHSESSRSFLLESSCSSLYSSEYSCMLMLFCMAFAFLYSAMRSIYIALSMTSVSSSPLTTGLEGMSYSKASKGHFDSYITIHRRQ